MPQDHSHTEHTIALDYRRCVSLWRAVVLQNFTDLKSKSLTKGTTYLKHDATDWLTRCTGDFNRVCEYADMHPDDVVKRAKQAISEGGIAWRAQRGKGKLYEIQKKNRLKHKKVKV